MQTPTANSTTTPWYHSRVAKWARDSLIILLLFWGISSWQTRDMLPTDGSVQIQTENLIGLDGEVHTVFASADKPTLVYFFAPWCKVCEMSIPNLNGLDESKINIVRVALDYSSSEDVASFVMKTRSEGPVLLGNRELKYRFQVPGYPSYYLLNDERRVVGKSMGYSTEWGMKLKSYLTNQAKTI